MCAVLPQYVVRPSVCMSVCMSDCDVQVQWSNRLEYFENTSKITSLPKVPDRIDPNIGDLVQREHPKIRVE